MVKITTTDVWTEVVRSKVASRRVANAQYGRTVELTANRLTLLASEPRERSGSGSLDHAAFGDQGSD
jgi:hypothetical protein